MNKCSSMFGQILQIFDKYAFHRAVKDTGSEKRTKGFSSWDQLVAMLFCQLGQAHSLREICGGLATCLGKLKHLGVKGAPSRSTLAYANQHRPWELFQQVFYHLLEQSRALGKGKKKFRFKNPLFSLDATMIELCCTLFDWAKYKTTKGAVKLHLLLDHDGYLPVFACVTSGNTHEVTIARNLSFPPGSILVMDRGYADYSFFGDLIEQGVFFVTRQRSNARYQVVKSLPVPRNRHVLEDQIIRFTGYYGSRRCSHLLRRVVVWDPVKQVTLVFLTNHFTLGATTVARIYKDRWQIELFFKALKQNLRIKTFVGTSCNALLIQIWTALIAMLLLKHLQFRSTLGWSLSNLVALLRYNLFTYRDLWEWLNDPFDTPSQVPPSTQLSFSF
jgi:hypothetical protein